MLQHPKEVHNWEQKTHHPLSDKEWVANAEELAKAHPKSTLRQHMQRKLAERRSGSIGKGKGKGDLAELGGDPERRERVEKLLEQANEMAHHVPGEAPHRLP